MGTFPNPPLITGDPPTDGQVAVYDAASGTWVASGPYASLSAPWTPATDYKAGQLASRGGFLWTAAADFTSSATFPDDLTAEAWIAPTAAATMWVFNSGAGGGYGLDGQFIAAASMALPSATSQVGSQFVSDLMVVDPGSSLGIPGFKLLDTDPNLKVTIPSGDTYFTVTSVDGTELLGYGANTTPLVMTAAEPQVSPAPSEASIYRQIGVDLSLDPELGVVTAAGGAFYFTVNVFAVPSIT